MAEVGKELDAHEANFVLGVTIVVGELVVSLLEIAGFGFTPVIEENLLMFFFDIFVDVIIDIEFGARRDDAFHLGHEILEGESLGRGDVVERFAAVDGADDVDFVFGLVGSHVDNDILRTFDLVVVDIRFDKVDERLAVFLGFGDAYAEAAGEFFDGARILDGHILERAVFEDDVEGEFLFLGDGAK